MQDKNQKNQKNSSFVKRINLKEIIKNKVNYSRDKKESRQINKINYLFKNDLNTISKNKNINENINGKKIQKIINKKQENLNEKIFFDENNNENYIKNQKIKNIINKFSPNNPENFYMNNKSEKFDFKINKQKKNLILQNYKFKSFISTKNKENNLLINNVYTNSSKNPSFVSQINNQEDLTQKNIISTSKRNSICIPNEKNSAIKINNLNEKDSETINLREKLKEYSSSLASPIEMKENKKNKNLLNGLFETGKLFNIILKYRGFYGY